MIEAKDLLLMYCQTGDLNSIKTISAQQKMILQDHGTLAMHAAVKYKHLHVVQYLAR